MKFDGEFHLWDMTYCINKYSYLFLLVMIFYDMNHITNFYHEFLSASSILPSFLYIDNNFRFDDFEILFFFQIWSDCESSSILDIVAMLVFVSFGMGLYSLA